MRWKPAHDQHAIEKVGVVFQFAEALPAKPWMALLNAATIDFGRKGFNVTLQETTVNIPSPIGADGQPIIQFSIGPGGVVSASRDQVGGGRTFQRVEAADLYEAVSINRNHFMYLATRYDGWAAYRQRLADVLLAYLKLSLELVNINALKLEYWDRFVFDGPSDTADYGELIDKRSPHVASFPFTGPHLWHSHIGYFLSPERATRRLVNLNVDAVDLSPSKQRSVGIYSMVQETLRDGSSPPTAGDAIALLDEPHAVLKNLIAGLLTVEAADRIGLHTGSIKE